MKKEPAAKGMPGWQPKQATFISYTMRVALPQPHPYLLNRAGGICPVKEFSLVDGKLNVVPAAEKPLTGIYHLIYRCEDHAYTDIKRAVSSDGTNWSMAEPLADDEDCDVCYPGPCN